MSDQAARPRRYYVLLVAGLAMVGLGSLWFMQGADLIHIRPVLCITDCTPITGGSTAWLVAGLIAVLPGALAVIASTRHLRGRERP